MPLLKKSYWPCYR